MMVQLTFTEGRVVVAQYHAPADQNYLVSLDMPIVLRDDENETVMWSGFELTPYVSTVSKRRAEYGTTNGGET